MALPTRALSISDGSLYIQKGMKLVLIDALDGKTITSWRLPYTGLQHLNRWSIRLNRLGVQSFVPLTKDKVVLLENHKIYKLDLATGEVNAVFEDFQGTRPLFLSQSDNGNLYFGEYFNNPSRGHVNIFASEDEGLTFKSVYTFPKDSIRHVHGVFFDRYSGDLWVTTGDDNSESHIWRTSDEFRTVESVVGGEQQYRAVQLLFTKEHIYFGSDTPLEQNNISRLNRKTGQVEKLQQVQGTVFYGCKVGDTLFFSTVVEPGSINKDKRVYLWGSRDGEEWHSILSYQKDMLPLKLFQYGQIRFPSGINKTGNLWFTPFSTSEDQTIKCIQAESLF
ncbi:MAG: hypothetical protein DRI65_05255 [Chloroflexota bacterium]|nr:MAG: hypothetical protein DRI65_05255 [Chloroflexota bacterium]